MNSGSRARIQKACCDARTSTTRAWPSGRRFPRATPRFALIDPDDLDEGSLALPFPLFVKPVKSWFSQYARRVDTFEELQRFVCSPGVRAHLATFVRPFDQLLARYSGFTFHGGYMLAEELLTGHQVTLEGFVQGGAMSIVGIVDSVMYHDRTELQALRLPVLRERDRRAAHDGNRRAGHGAHRL